MAKKLHQNQLIIRVPQSVLYWLIKQPPHQVRNMLLHLQKYLKYLRHEVTLHVSCIAEKIQTNKNSSFANLYSNFSLKSIKLFNIRTVSIPIHFMLLY